MRSRYAAYVLGLESYLLASWYPSNRPAALNIQFDKVQWLGLKVLRHQQRDAAHATVAFEVRMRCAGTRETMRELSYFVKEGQHWYYTHGDALV